MGQKCPALQQKTAPVRVRLDSKRDRGPIPGRPPGPSGFYRLPPGRVARCLGAFHSLSDNDWNSDAVAVAPDDCMEPLRAILTVSAVGHSFPACFEIIRHVIWDNPPVQVVETLSANDVDITVRRIEEESSASTIAKLVHQLHRAQNIFVHEVTCGPNPRWQQAARFSPSRT